MFKGLHIFYVEFTQSNHMYSQHLSKRKRVANMCDDRSVWMLGHFILTGSTDPITGLRPHRYWRDRGRGRRKWWGRLTVINILPLPEVQTPLRDWEERWHLSFSPFTTQWGLVRWIKQADASNIDIFPQASSLLLMHIQWPNKPVFSKGSSVQTRPHRYFDVKEIAHILEIIMPTPAALHSRTQSLQICVLHTLFYHRTRI